MLKFADEKPGIDWIGLGETVRGMQYMFERGIVFKTSHVAYHLRKFAKIFSKPMFIYVERNPMDVSLSILAARIAIYGRPDVWWSNYPPNYHELAQLPFPQQIAGQVRCLRTTYEQELRRISPELVLRVHYSQLCSSPRKVIAMIQKRVTAIYGVTVDRRLVPPERFEFKTRSEILDADQKAVIAAMMSDE